MHAENGRTGARADVNFRLLSFLVTRPIFKEPGMNILQAGELRMGLDNGL